MPVSANPLAQEILGGIAAIADQLKMLPEGDHIERQSLEGQLASLRKTARMIEDAATHTPITALAEACASIDGKLTEFVTERNTNTIGTGTYLGYLADAEELVDRLRDRGFALKSIAIEAQTSSC